MSSPAIPRTRHAWSEVIHARKIPARVCGKCGETWYHGEGGSPDPEPTNECIPTPTHDRHRLKLLERENRRLIDNTMQHFGIDMLIREGETPDEEKIRLRVELERERRMHRDTEHTLDKLLIGLQDVSDLPADVLEVCNGYWGDPLW